MDDEFKKMCSGIGKVICQARKHVGISQEELAHRAEIDRTYISQIERGISNPSLFIIHKVAKALDLPLAQLFQKH
ncbi:MAG: helix-turn-helix domain-containing protein [Methylophilaceae bacterium]